MRTETRPSRSILRVVNTHNIEVGTAFVVDDTHAITCAHVVLSALDRPISHRPQAHETVTLKSIHDDGPNPFYYACCLPNVWFPQSDFAKFGEVEDLAVLKLVSYGCQKFPGNVHRLPLRAVPLTTPEIYDSGNAYIFWNGRRINFTMNGLNEKGRLQLNPCDFDPRPGMSGSPVLSNSASGAVAVMALRNKVEAQLKGSYIAYALPIETLVQRWKPEGNQSVTVKTHLHPTKSGISKPDHSETGNFGTNDRIDFSRPFTIHQNRIEEKLPDVLSIHAVAIHPEGKKVAYAQDDKVFLLDVDNPFGRLYSDEVIDKKDGQSAHLNKVEEITFSPDGHYLVTGDNNGVFKVWDYEEKLVLVECHHHYDAISGIRFSPNGKNLAISSYDEFITVWDFDDLRLGLPTLKKEFAKDSQMRGVPQLGHNMERYSSLCFSHNGQHIASGDSGGYLKIFDVAQKAPICRVLVHEAQITATEFSPKDPFLIATCSMDTRIRLTNFRHGKPKKDDKVTLGVGKDKHKDGVTSIAFSYLGDVLISTSCNGEMKIWDVNTASLLKTFRHDERKIVERVAFFPNKYDFISDSYTHDISLWNICNDGSLDNTVITTNY